MPYSSARLALCSCVFAKALLYAITFQSCKPGERLQIAVQGVLQLSTTSLSDSPDDGMV